MWAGGSANHKLSFFFFLNLSHEKLSQTTADSFRNVNSVVAHTLDLGAFVKLLMIGRRYKPSAILSPHLSGLVLTVSAWNTQFQTSAWAGMFAVAALWHHPALKQILNLLHGEQLN